MSSLVTKFSDYAIQTVEFFIDSIEAELALRDLPGLFNERIEAIPVSKNHPIVTLMAKQLSESRNGDNLESGIIPGIGVTPGSQTDEIFTLAQSPKTEIIDDTFIDQLKYWSNQTDKETQKELLITKKQIDLIVGEYKRTPSGGMRAQVNEWQRPEEINVSVWSGSADVDIILGTLMDSIMSNIQVGTMGDNSNIRNMKSRVVKGLTNFNFGRVIYGSEYNLTFTNKYNNYTIFTDDVISEHTFEGTFIIPGETA